MQAKLSAIEKVAARLGGEIQGFINGLNEKIAERHSSVGFNASLDQSVQNVIKRAQNIKWHLNLSKFNAEALRCIVESLIPAFEKTTNSFSKFKTPTEFDSNFIAADSGFCSSPVDNVAQNTRELSEKFQLLCQNVEPTIPLTQKVLEALTVTSIPEQTTPSKTPTSNS